MAHGNQVNPTKLTPEQEDQFIQDCLNCIPLEKTATKFGFTSKSSLFYYTQKNPEFWTRIKQARIDACEFLEEKLLTLHEDFDSKMGKVMLEAYCRLLSFRNPQKYSQRIDLNLNQNVSITHNIKHANERVGQMMKDVTPAILPVALTANLPGKKNQT